jgi:antitoxin HigA-1
MTKKVPKRGLPPMHPGELLREKILPALERPKAEIANCLACHARRPMTFSKKSSR